MKTFKDLQPNDILYGVSRDGKFTKFIIVQLTIWYLCLSGELEKNNSK